MGGRHWLPLVLVALAVGAGGCSQTTPQPVTEAALTAPLVLNSAPGAAAPVTGTAIAPAAPVTASTTPAAAPPATAASTPAATQPTALQAEPIPTTAAAAATQSEGEFPNINKPPTQPSGTLLPEAARAEIISQLEALRSKQDAPGAGDSAGKPSELANQASTHGEAAIQQIEACSEDGALQNNPDCAPAD